MAMTLLPGKPQASTAAGKKNAIASTKIRRRELTFVLRNMATLVENGLPLIKALQTLAQERSLKKYQPIFEELCRQTESGNTFSSALALFPRTFPPLIVTQVRVAERSGTLAETLLRIADQLENADRTRALVIKKLSYPMILVGVGSLAITFLMLFVIPVFQSTYDDAGVPLPAITQFMIGAADFLKGFGWMIPLAVIAGVITFKKLRANPVTGVKIDQLIFKIPLLGDWFRNLCVLQFIEVLSNMLESGFTVAEALSMAAENIGNHAVRRCVEDLRNAVLQGARFSREIDKLDQFFPPVVTQLIVVGEKTGNLASTTLHIRDHLRAEIDRYTSVMVGTIEPVLTIGLAASIGVVVLAIYLPMFDMIGAMNGGGK
jgi:type IV pilus assembly protein PilC